MFTAVPIDWDPATPPHSGSYTRALLVSQDRRHLLLSPWAYLNREAEREVWRRLVERFGLSGVEANLTPPSPSSPTCLSCTKEPLRDIERSRLSLVLQTDSKSFRHCSLPRMVWGVMLEMQSMPRTCKSSYGGKVFQIFSISIYVNLNGFRANRFE